MTVMWEKPPLGTKISRWIEDKFSDPKWWDAKRDIDYRPWRGKTYNIVGGFGDWVQAHWPHKHFIEDDQCRKPEHRYCVWCMKRKPNAELSEITMIRFQKLDE